MKLLLGPLVGGLSHNHANIWARADSPAELHVWLATRSDFSDAAWAGSAPLSARNGHAGMVSLSGLRPEAKYFYAVSLRKKIPPRTQFHSFTTFPKPARPRSFKFMFGSCYLPPDEEGGQTMDEIRRHIESDDLRFGLLLGDQIYADFVNHNGIGRVAATLEDYRNIYEHTWSRPAMRRFLPSLPLFMTLDDHEIDNDWRWHGPDRLWGDLPIWEVLLRRMLGRPPQAWHLAPERIRAGLKACQEHQFMHAPKMLISLDMDAKGEYILKHHDPGSLAYTFYYGGAAFFVLDTRTMRVGAHERTMLGAGQWRVLKEWLKESKEYPVKFLVSSCSLLFPIFGDIARDRWSGFPEERERLLEFLAVEEIEGLHILTGDLHAGHAVTAELKCPSGRRIPIREFCASPFEQTSIYAGFMYQRVRSKWLANQRKHFYHADRNFGIVDVNFDSPAPAVTFTLHYNYKDKIWMTDSLTN
jgi:alkaline phosphatase D